MTILRSLFSPSANGHRPFAATATAVVVSAGVLLQPHVWATDFLIGRAVLPADTFADGPTSGRLQAPVNGVQTPFLNKQPVQGFSGILKNPDGTYWAMSDNGFGALENSADFNLRVYLIRPDFETQFGGTGNVQVLRYIELSDPDRKIPFTIVNQFTEQRVLTGGDFDIESIQRTADGTLWFGDEFGPFLLHTDANGKVLEAPYRLPDFQGGEGAELRSPQNPYNEESSVVRIMNALKFRGRAFGGQKTPIVSCDWNLLVTGQPSPNVPSRTAPPNGSGLQPASSKIFDKTLLHRAGFAIVPYTVNDKALMVGLIKLGVNGLISDRSDLLYQAVVEARPDFLTADGLIDPTKFDAQGHRGSRNLRPESTLPAFEAGLDNLMNTLETDCGITKDGIVVLSHDPFINPEKESRVEGDPIVGNPLIKDFTLEELQSTFRVDKLFRGPTQEKDPALSPVSVAFFGGDAGRIHMIPTLQQLFDFVNFYRAYYESGAGMGHPDAAKRAKNAAQVRFNLEIKINPRSDTDEFGRVYAKRTVDPNTFAEKVASAIADNHLTERATVQSFEFRSLLYVQQFYPEIRIVCLFGDFPKFANPTIAGSDDGTNLQPEPGQSTSPWLAGLYWPYRETALTRPFRALMSGGFEGMALSSDRQKLYPLLEQPLRGDDPKTLRIFEFDLPNRKYTGRQWLYRLDPRGTNIGDFQMFDSVKGLIIERDGTQGDVTGFKTVQEIELAAPGTYVKKRLGVDLLKVIDTFRLSLPGLPGDVAIDRSTFGMPFVTIEDLVIFDRKTIGVLNDNNYPNSVGRHVGAGKPDDNEFNIIKMDRSLTEPIP